jgi:hypothetical protein
MVLLNLAKFRKNNQSRTERSGARCAALGLDDGQDCFVSIDRQLFRVKLKFQYSNSRRATLMDHHKLLYAVQVCHLARQLFLAKHPNATEFRAGSEHYVEFMKAALSEVEASLQFIDVATEAAPGKALVESLHSRPIAAQLFGFVVLDGLAGEVKCQVPFAE